MCPHCNVSSMRGGIFLCVLSILFIDYPKYQEQSLHILGAQ